jgi:hypothetical protein
MVSLSTGIGVSEVISKVKDPVAVTIRIPITIKEITDCQIVFFEFCIFMTVLF